MRVEEVRALLARQVEEGGGPLAWGKLHGVSDTYVRDVTTGRRDPGPAVLGPLGLSKRTDVTYGPANSNEREAAGE